MKIFVYGTGCSAGDLVDSALPPERITAFVEEQPGGSFLGKQVIGLDRLAEEDADLIIVTVSHTQAVAKRLEALGIAPSRVFYLKNHLFLEDRNRACLTAKEVLGEAFVSEVEKAERLIRTPLRKEEDPLPEDALVTDYVRMKTLESVCGQITEVPGSAAELGVYRGGFARWISFLLPERRLYLFDTFCGFEEKEAASEGKGFVTAHRNTDAESVLSAMPYPEQVVIRKGLFPATAEGLEGERFAFVSLDADLEESTLAGLRWFAPRMAEGGFCFLHDYGNPKLPGVRRAVMRYQEETCCRLYCVPLCDICGTLVICF